MGRTILAAVLVYLLLLAGLATLNPLIITLAIPPALYLLSGLAGSPGKIALEVTRNVSSGRVPANVPVKITLTLKNNGPVLEEVLIEDPLPASLELVEGSNRRLIHLPAGKTISWSYTVKGKRGYYGMQHIRVEARDLLGVIKRDTYIPTSGQLFVMPLAPKVRRIVIRPRVTRVYSGIIPARQGGPGIEFYGVRDFQSGDSLRWINWLTTARHPQSIYTNEYEQERIADVGIIIDGRRRTNEFSDGRSIFEFSIQAAASLADAFLNSGNRVGLLVYGKYINWTIPGYGKIQKEKIMQALSRADTGDTQAFSNLIIPRRLFPRYSQMVLISPLHPDDLEVLIMLRSLGYQVMVISPNPVDFELFTLPSKESVQQAARIARLKRHMLINRLRRAGIQIVDWDVTIPFESVVQTVLSRPPAWLRAIGWRDSS